MGFYASTTPPLPGRIKGSPDDFEVREISSYPVPDPDGPFTVLSVRSSGWEQHELAERIAARLGLTPHALSWAGTKDRRAVATRLFSYRGSPPDRELGLPRVELLEAYRAHDGLVLGHHYGNSFRLRLLGPPPPSERWRESLDATRAELVELGWLPNFFGPQRFGEVRPVTHLVGRALLRGDPSGAVEAYLCEISEGSDGLGVEARRAYALHRDPARALREFPPSFRFERRLLEHLARGHSPERAIGALSRDLRTLFIHAYQARLFNDFASLRAAEGLSPSEVSVGDHVLRVAADGTVPGSSAVPVSLDNLSECRDLVERGRALVAGPLVGYETPPLTGAVGGRFEALLDREGIARGSFRVPKSPDLSSRGAFRPVGLPLPPIAIAEGPSAPAEPPSELSAWLSFSLPRGSYATVVVREFLKAGAT